MGFVGRGAALIHLLHVALYIYIYQSPQIVLAYQQKNQKIQVTETAIICIREQYHSIQTILALSNRIFWLFCW